MTDTVDEFSFLPAQAAEAGISPVPSVRRRSLSLPDGRFAAMPYYAGHLAFVFNEEALDERGSEF